MENENLKNGGQKSARKMVNKMSTFKEGKEQQLNENEEDIF